MTKLSITRALNELKLLDKRITKEIQYGEFVTYEINGKAQKEITPEATLQSITDLINRRAAIKAAIMKSNSVTTVKVAGKTMTVVEAIEFKDSIKYEIALRDALENAFSHVTYQVNEINDQMQNRLDKLLEATFGRDSRPKAEDYEAVAAPFEIKNKATLIDPLNIEALVIEKTTQIDAFLSEVDYVLSESNATTFIEV